LKKRKISEVASSVPSEEEKEAELKRIKIDVLNHYREMISSEITERFGTALVQLEAIQAFSDNVDTLSVGVSDFLQSFYSDLTELFSEQIDEVPDFKGKGRE
jgi:hypothetical protein